MPICQMRKTSFQQSLAADRTVRCAQYCYCHTCPDVHMVCPRRFTRQHVRCAQHELRAQQTCYYHSNNYTCLNKKSIFIADIIHWNNGYPIREIYRAILHDKIYQGRMPIWQEVMGDDDDWWLMMVDDWWRRQTMNYDDWFISVVVTTNNEGREEEVDDGR